MYSRKRKSFFSSSNDETIIMPIFAIFYIVGFINRIGADLDIKNVSHVYRMRFVLTFKRIAALYFKCVDM